MMQAMPRALAVAALVLALGTIVAFGVLLQRPVPVPVPPAVYLGALGLAVVLAALAVARSRRWLPVSALAISVLLLGLAGYFHFVLARVPATPTALVIGRPAPDFTLPDAAGRPVSLADYKGNKPVVLVFYRGYW